jgi:hypothetical protein
MYCSTCSLADVIGVPVVGGLMKLTMAVVVAFG